MAEYGYFFDAVQQNGAWDRTYEAADFAQLFDAAFTSGVIPGRAEGLAVTGGTNDAGTAPAVIVATGAALINGYMYVNTEAKKIGLSPIAGTTASRIDRVVIELNTSTRTMTARVLTGTPAGTPAAPALTWSDPVYQLAIADVVTVPGATTVAEIADKRGDVTVNIRGGWCGVRLKDADLRGLTETWLVKLRAVFDETTVNENEQDPATIITNLQTGIQEQLDTKVEYDLLYSPTQVALFNAQTLMDDKYKGYDALLILFRHTDGCALWKTTKVGTIEQKDKTRALNKDGKPYAYKVTAPSKASVTLSYPEETVSVVAVSGLRAVGMHQDTAGEIASRRVMYDSLAGTIAFSDATMGLKTKHGTYCTTQTWGTKSKTITYKTNKTKNITYNYALKDFASINHWMIPWRIYGIKGMI